MNYFKTSDKIVFYSFILLPLTTFNGYDCIRRDTHTRARALAQRMTHLSVEE